MTDEEKVPGVTFWFKSSAMVKAHSAAEKLRIDLHLDAVVSDEELWNDILQKFKDGFRVYTRRNFHEEIIHVMRSKSQETDGRIVQLEKELARERDLRKQTEAELEKYKAPLAAFGRGLRGE